MIKSSSSFKGPGAIGIAVVIMFIAAAPVFGVVDAPEALARFLDTPNGNVLAVIATDTPVPPQRARPASRPEQQNPERVVPQRRARPTIVRPGGRPEGIGRPQGARPQRVRPIRRPAPQ